MAGVVPYEKSELERVLEEERVTVRDTLNHRFLGGMPEATSEGVIGRWINWIRPSGDDNGNANIADPNRSDKSVITRINDAGEALIKADKTYVAENNFDGDVSSPSNVAAYIDKMTNTLRKLDKAGIEISNNDIKTVVASILKQAISSGGGIDSHIQKEWKSPIAEKNGGVAWVKYVFTLTNSIRESFYSSAQTIKINVKTYYSNDQTLK